MQGGSPDVEASTRTWEWEHYHALGVGALLIIMLYNSLVCSMLPFELPYHIIIIIIVYIYI